MTDDIVHVQTPDSKLTNADQAGVELNDAARQVQTATVMLAAALLSTPLETMVELYEIPELAYRPTRFVALTISPR